MTIQATLVDHATGETLAETELEAADLPPSFAKAEVVLEVAGEPWRVLHAEPDGRDAIARAGTLRLSLSRASAALTHEHPTRDDSLPAAQDLEHDHGLALPPGDWRQTELVVAPLRSSVEQEMEAIREVAKLGKPGAYPRCHVRTAVPNPLGALSLGRADIMKAVGEGETRALSLRGHGGVVKGGFALPMGESIVYGVVHGVGEQASALRVLGIGGHPVAAAQRLYPLAQAHGLLLVEWGPCRIWEPGAEGFVEA
jgi:hypothetical protein